MFEVHLGCIPSKWQLKVHSVSPLELGPCWICRTRRLSSHVVGSRTGCPTTTTLVKCRESPCNLKSSESAAHAILRLIEMGECQVQEPGQSKKTLSLAVGSDSAKARSCFRCQCLAAPGRMSSLVRSTVYMKQKLQIQPEESCIPTHPSFHHDDSRHDTAALPRLTVGGS